MEPDSIKQAYEDSLREVIATAEKLLTIPLVRDKTKEPRTHLAQLNNKVCNCGTLLAGFNKAVRGDLPAVAQTHEQQTVN